MKKLFLIAFCFFLIFKLEAQDTKTCNISAVGTLKSSFSFTEKRFVKNLTITGNLDARDFKFIRDSLFVLEVLDISTVTINGYTGYEEGPDSNRFGYSTYYAATIPGEAFRNKSLLKAITLPITITKIEGYAFNSCVNLVSIVIPNTVTTIYNDAFGSCDNLAMVTLGKSVTSVGSFCFAWCKSLSTFTVSSAFPLSFASNAYIFYSSIQSTSTLYVPKGSKTLYSEASGWNGFNNIVESPENFHLSTNSFSCPASVVTNETLAIETNQSWSVSSNQSWVTVGTVSGVGIGNIYLTVQPNSTYATRRAVIAVTVTNLGTQLIIIEQGAQTKTVTIEAGGLSTVISNTDLATIDQLVVYGKMDARDFKTIRDNMSLLRKLDIHQISIAAYSGRGGTGGSDSIAYPENAIPASAFNTSYYSINAKLMGIKLPLSIKLIDSYAFRNCSLLDSINIPNGVEKIGESAFANMSKLTTLTLPANLTELGNGSFTSCNLTDITIPANVKRIGWSAFESNNNLTSVVLPDSLSTIDYDAFRNCQNLKKINLPDKLSSIGSGCFLGCSGITTLSIPKTITSISASCFSGCTNLSSLTIPASVRTINPSSFSGCNAITEVNLPDSVAEIGASAFESCTGLKKVTLGKTIKTINEYTFRNCTKLNFIEIKTDLPPVFSYSYGAFDNVKVDSCTLKVPFGTKKIYAVADTWQNFKNIIEDDYGFMVDKNSIKLQSADSYSTKIGIQSNHSWSVQSDQSWVQPSPATGMSSDSITITVQENTTYLIRKARLTVTGDHNYVKYIDITQKAKSKWIEMTSGELKDNLSDIDFQNISDLSIIGSLDARDFKTIAKLTQLSTLNIACANITGYTGKEGTKQDTASVVYLPNVVPYYGLFNSSLSNIKLAGTVSRIDDYAFHSCDNLQTITCMNPRPLNVGFYVFPWMDLSKCVVYVPEYCRTSYLNDMNWDDFTLFVELGDIYLKYKTANFNYKNDTIANIPLSTKYKWKIYGLPSWIHVNQMEGKGNSTLGISVDTNNTDIARSSYFYIYGDSITTQIITVSQKQGPKVINCIAGNLKTMILPADYNNIFELYVSGTMDARDFKFIRDNLTYLTKIDFSAVSIVEYTGLDGTDNQASLNSAVTYPINVLPAYAFSLDEGYHFITNGRLSEIELPSEIVSIGRQAFGYCSGLKTLSMPNSVISIERSAFYECGIEKVNLSNQLKLIDRTVFGDCSVKEITLPESLTTINFSAFNTSKIESINIPASVTSIGDNAFSTTTLKAIYAYKATPLDISGSLPVFETVNKQTCILYVPQGSKGLYQQASQWKDFTNIVEMITGVNDVELENIQIIPNPVHEGFKILGLNQKYDISVSDLNGKVLLCKQVQNNEYISMSNFQSGNYVISIKSDHKIAVKKILKS